MLMIISSILTDLKNQDILKMILNAKLFIEHLHVQNKIKYQRYLT